MLHGGRVEFLTDFLGLIYWVYRSYLCDWSHHGQDSLQVLQLMDIIQGYFEVSWAFTCGWWRIDSYTILRKENTRKIETGGSLICNIAYAKSFTIYKMTGCFQKIHAYKYVGGKRLPVFSDRNHIGVLLSGFCLFLNRKGRLKDFWWKMWMMECCKHKSWD